MSQFKIEGWVSELSALLGSTEPLENLVDDVHKNFSNEPIGYTRRESKSYLKKLLQSSPTPDHLRTKYCELEEKKTDCLLPYLKLLALIAEDKKLKSRLESSVRSLSITPKSSSEDGSPSNIQCCVPEVRNRLLRVVLTHKDQNKKVFPSTTEQRKIKRNGEHYPSMPVWKSERPNSSVDFYDEAVGPPFSVPLGVIPAKSQVPMLIEDLLYCLRGIDGNYIVHNPLEHPYEPRTFTVSANVDPALSAMVKDILPLASHYSIITRFVEEKYRPEFGLVNHALVGALKQFLKDYIVLLAQLENVHTSGNFSLQALYFYIQPTLQTMEILSHICSASSKSSATGGKVLSLLHELTSNFNGDDKKQKLCLYLTQTACVPYMDILEKWVYKGVICDPYDEFLVEDNELIQKEALPLDYSADYWEKRYTIRRERIPIFLERVADVILRTGKYLNVIRQCGKQVKFPQADPIKYTIAEHHYVETIHKAYLFASKTLLDLLLNENDLIGRLRSVKHYFLLDQGDFIVQFMDSCESELSKNIDDVIPPRLESLLELVLRTSTANVDPYKDDMRTELLPYDLITQMFKILNITSFEEKDYCKPINNSKFTGIETFTFGYEVKWPISLVLNRQAIACYQMIFRHLFYCKHIERLLCRVWLHNKLGKRFPLSSSLTYVPAFALRQRMLDCVQNLEYYMMVEVIEPNWVSFLSEINKVSNVDEVLKCHCDFLELCLKDCMLTNPYLLRNVYKLLGVCVKFYNFMKSPEPQCDMEEYEGESFEQQIAKFDLKFTSMLIGLLKGINEKGRDESEKLTNLTYRLDFNGYYNEQIKKFNISDSSIQDSPESNHEVSG